MTGPDVEVQRTIAAPVDAVWALIGDPTAMSRFSPESVAQHWVPPSNGPAVGARFTGRNRNGIHRWSTRCTVVRHEPGRAIAWDVRYQGLAVARWQLALEPESAARTVVTQSFWDHRGAIMRFLGVVGRGVSDVVTHNRAGMEVTLRRLAAAAETSV